MRRTLSPTSSGVICWLSGLLLAWASVVQADTPSRWPLKGDEWYQMGAERRLVPVVGWEDNRTTVLVEDGGKRKKVAFEEAKYVSIADEVYLSTLRVCGRDHPGAFFAAASNADDVPKWGATFGEVIQLVRGSDRKPVRHTNGKQKYVLVWKWAKAPKDRSLAWLDEELILQRTNRPFELEAGVRPPPIFFAPGTLPTESLEKKTGKGQLNPRVLTKAVLKRDEKTLKVQNFHVPCHSAPAANAPVREKLGVLRHYYVYSVVKSGGTHWYLLGTNEYLTIPSPKENAPIDLIGWVRDEFTVIWGTAQSLEFDPVTRPQRTYFDPEGTLCGLGEIFGTFKELKSRFVDNELVDPKAKEIAASFSRALARMPVLEQKMLSIPDRGEFLAYKVAYIAANLKLAQEQQKQIDKLVENLDKLSTVEILFVLDTTLNSRAYRDVIRDTTMEIWKQAEQHHRRAETKADRAYQDLRIRVRAGVLGYRGHEDGTDELQHWQFTSDQKKFTSLFDSESSQRIVFKRGTTGSQASHLKALAVALSTGEINVPLNVPDDPDTPIRENLKQFNMGWTPGSQRVIVVLGDVGQKAQNDIWSRKRILQTWQQTLNKPTILSVQLGQHDWFTYPDEKSEQAAKEGYARFREDTLLLASEINRSDFVKQVGMEMARFVPLTQRTGNKRFSELSSVLGSMWKETVLARAISVHQQLAHFSRTHIFQVSEALGVQVTELQIKLPKKEDPAILYSEGWVLEKQAQRGVGFDVKQVRPCILIPKGDLNVLMLVLTDYKDRYTIAVEQARKAGNNAVGKILAKSLARQDPIVTQRLNDLMNRHQALHFLNGMLKLKPGDFEDEEKVGELAVNRWGIQIQHSLTSLTDYVLDRKNFSQEKTWLPLTLLPEDEGYLLLSNEQLTALLEDVLKPMHQGFLQSVGKVNKGDGKRSASDHLAEWRGTTPEGKKIDQVLGRAGLTQARIGLLSMSPEQIRRLSHAELMERHRWVHASIDICSTILKDDGLWNDVQGKSRTWFPLSRLPHPDNVRRRHEEQLATLYKKLKPQNKDN